MFAYIILCYCADVMGQRRCSPLINDFVGRHRSDEFRRRYNNNNTYKRISEKYYAGVKYNASGASVYGNNMEL